MYRAAMPDSDRVRATAQLTDGGDSWASANSFSARQLWEWMPVDIFAQTIGTADAVAEMSDLTSSGLRLSTFRLTHALHCYTSHDLLSS